MPRDGSTRDRRKALSRRRYVQLLMGTGAVGLAGCMGDGGGGTATPGDGGGETETTGGDATTATDAAAGTDTTSAADATDATEGGGTDATSTAGDDGTPQGEAVSDTVTVAVNNVPEQSNLNQYAATVRDAGNSFITDFSAPRVVTTSEILLSGHTWDVPWTDQFEEISIPTMYTDYSVEEPFDMYTTYNQDLTYWDGTPIDTDAKLQEDYLYHVADGFKFDDTATFNSEVVDQWNYHKWRDKGNVEGQEPDPAAARVLEPDAVPSNEVPPHPDFTTSYYDRYRDASSEDEASSITDELEGDTITFSRFAEEEFGSGPYHVDPDDVSQRRLVATLRDDHPIEHLTVPNLELRFAQPNRQGLLVQQGEIDVYGGIIQENGRFTPQNMPDYMQEYTFFNQPAGDHLLFNWENEHLQNLWVRRAIVAAVDWPQVGVNGWGAARSNPVNYHTGVPNTLSENAFPQEFLDSLYKYPMESDPQQASEWMQRAGYTREGGTWTSPDGTPFELVLTLNAGIADWVGAIQTIAANLDAVGLPTDFEGVPSSAWSNSLQPTNTSFEASIQWEDAEPAFAYYAAENGGAWYNSSMLEGDTSTNPPTTIFPSDYGETDSFGRPFETVIPQEVGSIEAPDETGKTADLDDGQQLSLPVVTKSLLEPGLSDEEYQQNLQLCARYYNYYLPSFTFHQYTWGMLGNVRDFSFPPEDHEANYTQKPSPLGDAYTTLGGLAQAKYDEEFPTPDTPHPSG